MGRDEGRRRAYRTLIDAGRGDVQKTFLDVPDGLIPGTSRLTVVLYPGTNVAVVNGEKVRGMHRIMRHGALCSVSEVDAARIRIAYRKPARPEAEPKIRVLGRSDDVDAG